MCVWLFLFLKKATNNILGEQLGKSEYRLSIKNTLMYEKMILWHVEEYPYVLETHAKIFIEIKCPYIYYLLYNYLKYM